MKPWLAHWAFLLGLFFIGSLWTQRGSSAEFKRIGIVSAFDPELMAVEQAIIPKKAETKIKEVNGTRFRLVDLYGKHLYFFLSGVSMVNAALTTQMAIDHFQLDAIIFSGIAGGNAMSGPVFLDNRDFREFAFRTWKVRLHEMEGTAIAQVGYVNRVPVLIVRGISDLAGGQRGPNWEETYTRLASRNAALVAAATLNKMIGQ